MRQEVNEPISVYFVSDPGRQIKPLFLAWRGKSYKVDQISHTFSLPGGKLSAGGRRHVYCLIGEGYYFEIWLDPLTMVFTLREMSDGSPG